MPRCLLILSLLLMPFILAGQNRELDSLKREFAACTDDNCRIHILTYWGDAWYMLSADSALEYTERGLKLADKYTGIKDTTYFQSLTALLNNSAFLNQRKGNLYKAITLYNRSLDVAEIAHDSAQMTTTLLNLSSLYYDIEDDSTAEKYLAIFMRLIPEKDDGVAMGNALNILGKIALRRNNTELALNHFTTAINFYKKTNNSVAIGRSSMLIGKVYFQQRQIQLAKSYYDQGYANLKDSWDKRAFCDCALLLSKWHDNQHNIDSALYFATLAYDNAVAMDYAIGIRDGAEQLSKLFEDDNRPVEALKYYHIFVEKTTMLRGQDVVRIGTREQLRADFEKQQAEEKAKQDQEKLIQDESIRRQKIYTWSSIGIGVLLLTILMIGVRSYRNKQRSEQQISSQKELLEIKNKEIEDSIVVADRIQRALFPSQEIWKKAHPESFIFYRPKDIVSGDFYWTGTSGVYTYVACCDSTGHGVPGAFVSLLNISFINEAINERGISDPGAILDFVRKRLSERLTDAQTNEGMDGILLRFSATNPHELTYAAAYNRPIVVRNKSVETLHADKMPVGKSILKESPFQSFTFQLEKSDLLILYTDGFADQFGGPLGKKFKYKALEQLLSDSSEKTCSQIAEILDQKFAAWKGNMEQTDDVLVIGIRI